MDFKDHDRNMVRWQTCEVGSARLSTTCSHPGMRCTKVLDPTDVPHDLGCAVLRRVLVQRGGYIIYHQPVEEEDGKAHMLEERSLTVDKGRDRGG